MIEAQTITIWENETLDGRGATLQLVDALVEFGKAGETRRLTTKAEDRGVKCELLVPLLRDCLVRPQELGRALRKVWRAAIVVGEPGDHFTIDLSVSPDTRLVISARRVAYAVR